MAKQHFIIIDTETTQDGKVADFAAVVCDRKGAVVNQCAILINGVFTDPVSHPLFFDSKAEPEALWSKAGQDRRYATYNAMLLNGGRMIASVAAVNSWISKAIAQYNPILTAYNLPFDLDKCTKTGINLSVFSKRFCLWDSAYSLLAQSKGYRQFVLDNHLFNARTENGNLTYQVKAETVGNYINGGTSKEPHTALEDIIFYELPILAYILKRKSVKWCVENPSRYNWRAVQVRDWFKPK